VPAVVAAAVVVAAEVAAVVAVEVAAVAEPVGMVAVKGSLGEEGEA
jgi:hypothetical protein